MTDLIGGISFCYPEIDVSSLVGKTFVDVSLVSKVTEDPPFAVFFVGNNGDLYALAHVQDCCENVWVEDVCGDLNDLIGSPILEAEMSTNSDVPKVHEDDDWSNTWTFFKFRTSNGCVTIRFYGTSNGYYSEDAHLFRCEVKVPGGE